MAGGLYVDGVAAFTHYDIDARTVRGASGSTDAHGWTVSGEAGWHRVLSERVTWTPQAQVFWQTANIDKLRLELWVRTRSIDLWW